MKKLNKKQKEHIKKVFVKTINIFCYICTGILSIILLVVCLQGCHNKPQKVSAESYTSLINHTYKVKYTAPALNTIDSHDISDLTEIYGLGQYTISGADEVLTNTLPVGSKLYINSTGTYVDIDTIKVTFSRYVYAGSTYLWRLKNIVVYQESATYTLIYKYNDNYSNYQYYFNGYGYILSDGTLYNDIKALPYFYYNDEHSYFTFNQSFNYNAPFGIVRNTPSNPVPPSGVTGTYLDFDFGYFESNGQVFNKIRWNIRNNSGEEFWLNTGEEVISSHSYYGFTWVSLQYINTDTNTFIDVCSRTTGIGLVNGTYVQFYQLNNLWQIDEYRYITILQYISPTNKENLEQFNNNNQTSYGGGVVSGEVNNIFTLIGSAIAGLMPILSVAILPGITIGTLMFIPLVALLVFAIIRIIKK